MLAELVFMNAAIFIFTRDRPNVLATCLASISDVGTRRYVIDDSYDKVNQISNSNLTSRYAGVSYVGKDYFLKCVTSLHLHEADFGVLLRQLGHYEWNLGYARNFALFFSKAEDVSRALFLDDDITVPDTVMVMESFAKLDEYDFIGAPIKGMGDDSIVGFMSSDLGISDPDGRMLAGGFLAFEPRKITEPFINVYNEDWIWQLMHPTRRRHELDRGVFHRHADPYADFKCKIRFQERGEIITAGMLNPKYTGDLEALASVEFWNDAIIRRKSFLHDVHRAAQASEQKKYLEMIKWLLQDYDAYDGRVFADCFNTQSRAKWLLGEACGEM